MSDSTLEVSWGRAFIGYVGTLLPARMVTSRESIEIKAFGGTYYFSSSCVVRIEDVNNAVIIHHVIQNYPAKIVFVSQQIPNVSKFSPSADGELSKRLPLDGQPLKSWATVVYSTVWITSLLIQSEYLRYEISILLMGFFIFVCFVLFISKRLQLLILKPGRHFAEIRPRVILVTAVLSVMLPILAIRPYVCESFAYVCRKHWY